MKRERIIDGVKYSCANNASYIKGEGNNTYSCKKYAIMYYDKSLNGWCHTGRYCNTIREFHEDF